MVNLDVAPVPSALVVGEPDVSGALWSLFTISSFGMRDVAALDTLVRAGATQE